MKYQALNYRLTNAKLTDRGLLLGAWGYVGFQGQYRSRSASAGWMGRAMEIKKIRKGGNVPRTRVPPAFFEVHVMISSLRHVCKNKKASTYEVHIFFFNIFLCQGMAHGGRSKIDRPIVIRETVYPGSPEVGITSNRFSPT